MIKNSKLILIIPAFLFMKAGLAQHPLSLAEALNLAQKQNRQIQIASLEAGKAAERVKEQRSDLLPSVSANAAYSFFAERPVIFLRDPSSSQKVSPTQVGGRNVTQAGLAVVYPVVQPATHARIRLAGLSARAEQEKATHLVNEVLFEVAKTYFTVRYFADQKELLKQSLGRYEHALQDSRLLLLQGKGLKTDTLRNYIDVQNLRASILSIESRMAVETSQLQQLLGLTDADSIILVDNLPLHPGPGIVPELKSLVELAIENRHDMKAAQLLIGSRKEEQRLVTADFKPSINAFAQYQLQSQGDGFGIWNHSFPRTSFAGIQLNVPIYSGKKKKYRGAIAANTVRQAELALDDLRQSLSVEISNIMKKMQDAHLQIEIQDGNVKAAQVNFRMINDRYKQGLSNRLELADAELMLTQAKLEQKHAIFVLKILELELDKATGSLVNG